MKSERKRWRRRLNGTVCVERIPRSEWAVTKADGCIKEKYLYTWRPPYQIACRLPEGLVFRFECWEDRNGLRRFHPDKTTGAFIFEASLAGAALLADHGKEGDHLLSYDEARLFNQYSRHTREYLGPATKLGRVLSISPTGRPDAGTKNILPDEIGLDSHGRNEPWDVREIKRRGLAAAQSAGISNPTPDEIVRRALYEAARLNPLKSSEAETRGLLQLAFYSLGPELGKVDADAVRYCAEQVKASLKDHLQDTRTGFKTA